MQKKLGCNVTKKAKAKASEDYLPTFKEFSHEEKWKLQLKSLEWILIII